MSRLSLLFFLVCVSFLPSALLTTPSTLAGARKGSTTAAAPRVEGLEWVPFPAGMFQMGSDKHSAHEKSARKVHVSAFSMLKTEVTVAQYQACEEAGHCSGVGFTTGCSTRLPEEFNHPLNCTEWEQARSFCEWIGGRLPTEAEWEYAARGGADGGDREFPWGNEEPTCERVVMNLDGDHPGCGKKTTWPVCSKPAGNTPQGLCDMAGNAAEWVADWYQSDYYESCAKGCNNPRGPETGEWRVVRGGSFVDLYPDMLRTTFRGLFPPKWKRGQNGYPGFRCVKTP
ncbi:MAG: SUMF1/EgtB/PvdO family nonheme iron enzyme [Pseudomonadota bacterium]